LTVPPAFPTPPVGSDAQALVQWAADTFGDELALACSAGVEDSVLVHLAAQTGHAVRVFMLDTGRLHPETHETFERLRLRYPGLRFEVYSPQGTEVEALVAAQGGLFGFREGLEQRHACCEVRKLRPLQRALAGSRAWLTGLRREQSPTRADLQPAEPDRGTPERLKIAPLLDWDLGRLWAFVKANQIPTHPLHEVGFPSIGCAPCTRAIQPGEDLRAGRWWWELPEHKECGLHNRPDLKQGGPPSRIVPSTSPLVLPHEVSRQSPDTPPAAKQTSHP
jgi:phosphoadenosine phosphosulfate reductase